MLLPAEADQPERLTITVTINGTDANPWARYQLKANPFPQLAKAEYDGAERALASLDGEPVRTAEDIRARLRGFSEEFVAGCIARWQPGKRISFSVSFPADRGAS
jgi:hypothetical protein